jgi:aspartate carbamoyltransferase
MSHPKSILTMDSLDNPSIRYIMERAFYYKDHIHTTKLKDKIVGQLFFEPSTRTHSSFLAAAYRSGAEVIDYNPETSSAKKGESLKDTVKTLEQYCDALVIRHPVEGMVKQLADHVDIPVINAGDGSGEHPTQALLDFFTMVPYFPKGRTTVVTFCGDLKYSRVFHSLVRLMDRLKCGILFIFVSDPALQVSEALTKRLKNEYRCKSKLSDVIEGTDILYMTRLQKERFEGNLQVEPMILTPSLLSNAKASMIVLHALPRNEELPETCDGDPRCKFIEQMKNGVYVRMAVLDYCLKTEERMGFFSWFNKT